MLRLRRIAAMVTLGAAVVGSIAIATPAQAARLGQVTVYNDTTWNTGWNECLRYYPGTHSIRSDGSYSSPFGWATYWICYDTTNGT
jgi:hypothetical protein